MIKLYYFTDTILKIAFNVTLDSHLINHAISILSSTPNYLENEKIYVNRIMRQMAKTHARVTNQNKLK